MVIPILIGDHVPVIRRLLQGLHWTDWFRYDLLLVLDHFNDSSSNDRMKQPKNAL